MLSLSLLSLAFLLTPALAIGPSQPEHKVPPKVAPTKFENFTWADPFSSSKIGQFDVACESSRKFTAHEYQIHDLHDPEPIGLAPYGEALKSIFGGRPYPGGWDGMDPHGYERTLVKMAYETVPVRVKEWIAEQETTRGPGKGLFAVYDKPDKVDQEVSTTADLGESGDDRSLDEKRVVIFAPGAIYDTLPLWVAEDSKCEDTLGDLDNYSPQLVDGGVVGWPIHYTTPSRRKGLREIEFILKAQVLNTRTETVIKENTQDTVKTDVKDEL